MDDGDSRALLASRWFHPLLGVLGLLALAVATVVDQHTVPTVVVELALPIALLALFLFASNRYVVDELGLADADLWRINRWTLLGIGFLGASELAFNWLPQVVGGVDYVYELVGLGTVGAIVGTLVGVTNVRERDRTREAQQLNRAVEASAEGLAMVDENDEYTFVNSTYAEMHGTESSALVGTRWRSLTPPDVLAAKRSEIRETLDETGSWQGRLDGTHLEHGRFPRRLTITRTADDKRIIVARDVTPEVRHERRLRTLQEAVLDLQEADGETAVAETMVSIAQDLVGEELTVYLSYDPAGDQLEVDALSDESSAFVDRFDLGDDIVPWGPETIAYEAFAREEVSVVENYAAAATGADIQAPLGTILFAPVADHGLLMVGSVEQFEVTESDRYVARILAQNSANAFNRVAYETELEVQNTRLEFLNSLLRHDVLNGMTIIRAHAEEMKRKAADAEKRHGEVIVKWTDNVTQLVTRVRRLLEVLTPQAEGRALEPVDVVPGVHEEVERLRGAYPDTEFRVDVPAELTVLADDIVHDVIANLVRNAAEHNRADGAWVAVAAGRGDEVTADDAAKDPAVPDTTADQETVRLVVADNGPGVPDDAKDRIFRRGETGHAKESGSGFGLFFVDSMVTQWGGSVTVMDRPGGGSRFVVDIPAA